MEPSALTLLLPARDNMVPVSLLPAAPRYNDGGWAMGGLAN